MARAIRLRMYRVGFGDCFLVSFGADASARHMLVDMGVHQRGDIGTLEDVMSDIESVTHARIDIVVASHAHRDHISGFGQFTQRFAKFKIREVWLPWTDNTKDPAAAALQKKHLSLYEGLHSPPVSAPGQRSASWPRETRWRKRGESPGYRRASWARRGTRTSCLA